MTDQNSFVSIDQLLADTSDYVRAAYGALTYHQRRTIVVAMETDLSSYFTQNRVQVRRTLPVDLRSKVPLRLQSTFTILLQAHQCAMAADDHGSFFHDSKYNVKYTDATYRLREYLLRFDASNGIYGRLGSGHYHLLVPRLERFCDARKDTYSFEQAFQLHVSPLRWNALQDRLSGREIFHEAAQKILYLGSKDKSPSLIPFFQQYNFKTDSFEQHNGTLKFVPAVFGPSWEQLFYRSLSEDIRMKVERVVSGEDLCDRIDQGLINLAKRL